jgi:hypothetical protein
MMDPTLNRAGLGFNEMMHRKHEPESWHMVRCSANVSCSMAIGGPVILLNSDEYDKFLNGEENTMAGGLKFRAGFTDTQNMTEETMY